MTVTLSGTFCNSLSQEITSFRNSTKLLIHGDDHQEEDDIYSVIFLNMNTIYPVLISGASRQL